MGYLSSEYVIRGYINLYFMRQKSNTARLLRPVPDFIIKEHTSYHLIKRDEILYFQDGKEYCQCVSVHGRVFRISLSFHEIVNHVKFSDHFMHLHRWLINHDHLKGVIRKEKEVRIQLRNGIILRFYNDEHNNEDNFL